MHSNFIQMPPDGVGKKIITNKTYIIPVNTTIGISLEDELATTAFGSAKLVVKQINAYSGILYCMYKSSSNEGSSYTIGQKFYRAGTNTELCTAQAQGTQTGPEFYYANMSMNVSYDNPYHGQIIDAEGQAFVRYAEGAQGIDSHGNSKFSQAKQIGVYSFSSSAAVVNEIGVTKTVNGNVVQQANDRSLLLTTDTTNGSSVICQTNKYHFYNPGNGLYVSTLVKSGDRGTANVQRRWGYFDDANGVFFQLDGTELSIVWRSSTTGSTIDTKILQSAWSEDILDGSGISKENLDVSLINRYWMDFAYGNKTRIGIYGGHGQRIICHVIECSNRDITIDFASLSLPMRIEQTNLDTVGTGTELKWFRGNVQLEGMETEYTSLFEGGSNIVSNVSSASWIPLITLRPQSSSNHALALIKQISISCVDSADDTRDGRVKLEVFKNSTLTGANFNNLRTNSYFEYDKSATAMTGGTAISEHLVKGTSNFDFSSFCNYLDEYIIQNQDGTQNSYTLAVKAIKSNVDCNGAIVWEEYHI